MNANRGLDDTQLSTLIYEDTLPEKSREKYNSCYNKFIEWKNEREIKQLSEDVILEYFIEMSQMKKPSTLLSTYSMLKQTILTNDDIDISDYRKLHLFLKKKSFGYQSQKPKIFTTNDIERFLNEAPDRKYLVAKVAFILGIAGACRSDELCNITMKDIEDNGTCVQLRIRNPDTNVERTFTVSDGFYKIYRKYVDLRPNNLKTDRFFMKYNDGKCAHQVIGIHKFGGMPRLIASWLQLPEADAYTGHSFRLTSATLLADSGDDIMALGRHVGLARCENENFTQSLLIKKQQACEKLPESVIPNQCTSTISSSSSTLSISSASNFEAVYLPVKDECDDRDNPSILRDSNPFIDNDRSHTQTKLHSPSTSSGRSLKVANPLALTTTPIPANQRQVPSKTLVLNTIPLKVKQVAPMTIRMQPKPQQIVKVAQNGVRPQSAEVCLRWNSYHSNMQNSFPSLLDSEDFVDVTLACEGKSVKCHKIILSSCSDYLAQLLRENPCPHPIIFMKDLKFWEIEALVKFMYRGEVNVAHDKLPQFLNAARALQVKGLTNSSPSQVPKPAPVTPQSKPPLSSVPGVLSKPLEVKDKNSQVNLSTTQRGAKRPLETPEPRPFTKIRLRRQQSMTHPGSPEIKSDPLNVESLELEHNNDNSMKKEENKMRMDRENDTGEQEHSDCPDDDDVQSETPGSFGDINDNSEQMEVVPTDFLDQDQNYMNETDDESSRSSIVEIKDGDNRSEGADDEIENIDSGEKDET